MKPHRRARASRPPKTAAKRGDELAARTLRSLVHGLQMLGRDPAALLESVGITEELVGDPLAWVPAEAALRAWELGTRDLPLLGLRVVEAVPFTFFALSEVPLDHLLAQMMVTSATAPRSTRWPTSPSSPIGSPG